MNKTISQIVLVMAVILLLLGAFVFFQKMLQMPFRETNDALHEKGAAFTLDFLIPAGTYIDKKITIGELAKIRISQKSSPFESAAQALSDRIPSRYIWLGNGLLFCFWSFCVLTLLRVFTFMGYGRALRSSLLMGGIIYYFMPDFALNQWEDILFILCPFLLIAGRFWFKRRKRRIKEA